MNVRNVSIILAISTTFVVVSSCVDEPVPPSAPAEPSVCEHDCEIYGCACAACPPPEALGEVMCPGTGDPGPMIADSADCPLPPRPDCVLSDVEWDCPSGAHVRPWCCPWPDWTDGGTAGGGGAPAAPVCSSDPSACSATAAAACGATDKPFVCGEGLDLRPACSLAPVDCDSSVRLFCCP